VFSVPAPCEICYFKKIVREARPDMRSWNGRMPWVVSVGWGTFW